MKILKYVLAFLLAFSLGLYFRLYPLLTYSSSENSEKASLIAVTQLRAKVAEQVKKSNPNLSQAEQNALTKNLFDQIVKKDAQELRHRIEQLAKTLELTQSGRGFPYLLESDPFYYYNLTENISIDGKISDTVKGSKYLNRLMLAPDGHWEPLNLNPYVGYFIYRITKIFDPDIPLINAVSFTPLVISALCIIPLIFICVRLGCSLPVASVASVFLLLAPIFIKRSSLGWYDNDPYNVFFPLCILSVFFMEFKARYFLKDILLAAIIILYTFFWQGWVYLFSVICIGRFMIVLKDIAIQDKKSLKTEFKSWLAFMLFVFVGVSINFGPSDFFKLFEEGWRALQGFLSPQLSAWPDIYISVGELRSSSWSYLIEYTGGAFFNIVSLLGFFVLLWEGIRNLKSKQTNQSIILSVFFILTFIISKGAQRFTILLIIPLCILFAYGLKAIQGALQNFFKHFLKDGLILKLANIVLNVFLIMSILFPVFYLKKNMNTILNPIYNATWEKALLDIKTRTPKDSIINAWWPPGHFIKAIAKRRVTFDGATINFPQAYWMADVYLSSNERQAAGILRMLNTNANKATEYLSNEGLPLSQAVPLVKFITPLSYELAKITLSTKLPSDKVQKVLALTHGRPPPSYLFIYGEFVENNLQLPFIAHWNFKRIEEINQDPSLLKQVPKANSKEYIDFLWQLSGGPYRYSGILNQLSQKDDVLGFSEGLRVDLKTKNCSVDSSHYGKGIPKSIFYVENKDVVEKTLENATLPYSVILFKDSPQSYGAVLLDRPLAQSLLVRLYFFNGTGLKYFKPFIYESDLTKRTVIKVFEVDWQAFKKDIGEK